MRLLKFDNQDCLTLTGDLSHDVPPYAILSHTWGRDVDEVTLNDLQNGVGRQKLGYAKIQFCGQRAKKDGIDHFWIDTCCIDKSNHVELSEAIVSMFRWYRDAEKCYVYLSDVSSNGSKLSADGVGDIQPAFRESRWFKRGWTLQELLAPRVVEFFCQQEALIGTKESLLQLIHEITGVDVAALQGAPLSYYSVSERMRWAAQRQTKKPEDKAYCLFGIFDVYLPLIYGEGDHAFLRLREAIDKQIDASQTSTHAHWCVSRPANTLFTGRRDILADIEKLIRETMANPSGGEQCRIVVSGLGGQGKSEICLQLCRRLRNRFWTVLWIDVSTEADAERSYLDVARKLSIPAESWEDARHGISNLRHPWLMILDNADDLSIDYSEYIPDGNPGVVVLTSRNDECQQYASTEKGSIVLESLSTRDARDLLLKAARVRQDQYRDRKREAEEVAELLQSHALAIVQAGAYISNGHCTLSEYPQMYQFQRKRLLGFRPRQAKSRYGDIYATFEVSADILKNSKDRAAQDALQLLSMLAICGPNRFPLLLFRAAWHGVRNLPADAITKSAETFEFGRLTEWLSLHLPALLGATDATWDSFRLMEAVHMLRTLSLITLDTEDGQHFVSMHALVHVWTRDRQNQADVHRSWLQMSCLMVFALAGHEISPQGERQLRPHCEMMTLWNMGTIYSSEPPVFVTRILVKCGWHLRRIGADAHLLNFVQNILCHLNINFLHVDENWMSVYDLAASSLRDSGKVLESIALSEKLLQLRERKLPVDDPALLFCQNTLAIAYRDNGQTSKAIALLEHVVAVEERSLAEDHHGRLASQQVLAAAYVSNGQTDQAIAILEHILKLAERILTEDHPDRLAYQHTLAMAYNENGQTNKAITLLEYVVEVKERILPEDHSSRLASQEELGRICYKNGQMRPAIALLEHVVEVQNRVLREDHPNHLISQHNLAMCYWKLGRHEPACAMLTKVVEVQKHSLADDHPHRQAYQKRLERMQKEMAQMVMNS